MNETTPVPGPVREKLNPVVGNAIVAVLALILGHILFIAVMITGVITRGFPFFLWQFIFVIPIAMVASLLVKRLNGSVVLLAAGTEATVRILTKRFGIVFMKLLADVPVIKPIIGYAMTGLAFVLVLFAARFLKKVSDKTAFLVPVAVVLVAVLDWLVQWTLGWGFVF